MEKYCRADVELLSKTVLKFRKMFIDKLDTDPFRYTTLASLCMSIYSNKFMPDKTIVGNNSNKQDSLVCREWLNYLNNDNIVPEVPISIKYFNNEDIHKNKIGDDTKQYYNLRKHFTADGYDKTTKTVYLFQGCYWHGCRKCHPENKVKYNKTMEQVNLYTMNKYKVEQIWECEWNEIKQSLPNKFELEEQARNQNIKIRDAFFGGRTEGFKSYHKCNENQQIFYYDVVSLYPTVNALDEYAIGFSKYVNITLDDINCNKDIWKNFAGLLKIDIEPPKNIYVPILPDNSNKKILFHLNDMKQKTFTSIEIKEAIKYGYKITKVYSALKFDKYTGLMKDYVEFFLKIKIENNKYYTPEECKRINESHKQLGFNFEVESQNTCKNPGMKQLAKICLNSLWGKFGQRSCLDSYEYITEWNRMLLQLGNKTTNTKSWHIINDGCIEMRYNEINDYTVESEYISEITAAFTTANARIRLMSMLNWLNPSQLIYCDTDSVIFLYDKTDKNHKYPTNDDKTKPSNIRFGDALGEWENEFSNDEWISEIVVGGAKSYSYMTNKGKIIIKQKGITLDRANSNIFTFDNVRKIVLENETLTSEKRYQFTWNKTTKDIETKYVSRSASSTIDSKRILLDNYDTLPMGYKL